MFVPGARRRLKPRWPIPAVRPRDRRAVPAGADPCATVARAWGIPRRSGFRARRSGCIGLERLTDFAAGPVTRWWRGRAAAVDERRARIYDDLRGIIDGELYFEPLDRAPYAHDASLYEIDPFGVVVPRTEADVVTIVRYAAEHELAIHPRGAGSDTGGG